MANRSQRVGQTHGVFRVKAFAGTGGSQGTKMSLWLCECTVCGNEVIRENRYFRSDRPEPKACSNCAWKLPYKGYEEISKTYWSRIVMQAEERGLKFEITEGYCWGLFLEQGRKCFYTARPLKFSKKGQTASLDRIDSDFGYVEGNVKWVHKDINRMKGCLKHEDFVRLCSEVYHEKVEREPSAWEVK